MAEIDLSASGGLSDIPSKLFSPYLSHRNPLWTVGFSRHRAPALFATHVGGNAEPCLTLALAPAQQLLGCRALALPAKTAKAATEVLPADISTRYRLLKHSSTFARGDSFDRFR